MPCDVVRLSVRFRLLMQQFDRRHLAAAIGDLDAVADQDVPAVDAQRLGQQAKYQRGPQRGELVELDGGGVEIVTERIVATRIEVQCAHDGGDSDPMGKRRESYIFNDTPTTE